MSGPAEPASDPAGRGWWWRWLWQALLPLALTLAAALLYLRRLGAQSLWLDEGYAAWYVSEQFVGRLIADLWSPTQAYPLYHLLLKLTTRLLGDSEWALRLPSALAGLLAVPAIYALGSEVRSRWLGLSAALLLLAAPFAIWQAQDAKAYSLTLLITILLWWSLVRAVRLQRRSAWVVWGGLALLAPFVHRLLLLVLIGCGAALLVYAPGLKRRTRQVAGATLAVGAALLIAAIGLSLRRQGASGQFSAAGPLTAMQITLHKFALDRGPGEIARRWLVPFAVLLLLGGLQAIRDWRRGGADRRAVGQILLLGGIPLALFLGLLAQQRLYEPRYLILVYPAWLLLLAWGIAAPLMINRPTWLERAQVLGATCALLGVFAAERAALVQPGRGLWSGAAVKEDYRGAVGELAGRVHPDDQVIVHPESVLPLYAYYAKRLSPQPLPEATVFSPFDRTKGFERYELNTRIGPALRTHKRAWLFIAPAHANLVDPPPTAGDEVGWIGLAFQYADTNGRIPCANPSPARFNGVWLYCNNMPDIAGRTPEPKQPTTVDFADQVRLRGITVTPFTTGLRPGGTLPLSLFWEPLVSLADTDYHVFIHLTRPDDPTVLAQTDGRPMEGGQPTSRWIKPRVLLHDDRTLPLPADLPPGRYVVRVGLYRLVANGAERLPITQTNVPALDQAAIIATVEVQD